MGKNLIACCRDKTLVISVPSLTELSARLPPDLANPVVVQLRWARRRHWFELCGDALCQLCMQLSFGVRSAARRGLHRPARCPAHHPLPSSSLPSPLCCSNHIATSKFPFSDGQGAAPCRTACLTACLPACLQTSPRLACPACASLPARLQRRFVHRDDTAPSPFPPLPPGAPHRPCCSLAGSEGSMSNAASFMSLEELKHMEVGPHGGCVQFARNSLLNGLICCWRS